MLTKGGSLPLPLFRWPVLRRRVFAFFITGVAFAALTLWARSGSYLPGEQELLRWIITHRLTALNPLLLLISTLGSINLILPLWALSIAIFALWKKGAAVLRLLPVPLGYPLYTIVKSCVGRPGPTAPTYPWLYDLPLGYFVEGLLRRQLKEMPAQGVAVPVAPQPVTAEAVTRVMESGYVSGHALVAGIFYGTLALCLWALLMRNPRRWLVIVPLAALALLVGVARIYMGIHFPSDVLGAWLLGVLFLVFIETVVEVILPPLTSRWQSIRTKGIAPT